MKIRADVNGYITGIRFYKSRRQHRHAHRAPVVEQRANCSPRPRSPVRPASGWQQVNFATPVAITAGVTYTASYHTTSGHYSSTRNFSATPSTAARCTRWPTARAPTACMPTAPAASRRKVTNPRTTGSTRCSAPRRRWTRPRRPSPASLLRRARTTSPRPRRSP